jgi:hypothetical protein
MEATYWSHKGTFQVFINSLNEMIPVEGKVPFPRKNKKLERFRAASNAYYDIFNNGGGNRRSEIRYYFDGLALSNYSVGRTLMWNEIHRKVEPIMDQIVKEAAIEQGLITADVFDSYMSLAA